MHQKPKLDLPLFLAETNRKLSGYIYMSDKNFATFFIRPPMVGGSFCLCKISLDLEDGQ